MHILWSLAVGLFLCFLHTTSGYYQGNGDIQNEYVRTGSNATLFCQPSSDVDNINRIIWYKEDKKLVEVVNGRRTFWDAGQHVNFQQHNNALYFRRVTYPDSGEYYCEVNNKRARNSLARLLVQGKCSECPDNLPDTVKSSTASNMDTIIALNMTTMETNALNVLTTFQIQ